MFSLHQKVVYPGHGVAYINRILEKDVSGKKMTFFELQFMSNNVTVLVPFDNAAHAGIRLLSTEEHVNDAFLLLTQPARKISPYEFTASSWNKRNKDYQLKLRNGTLSELIEIYRDLRFIATQKELSFGEKNILSRAESLLVEEIAIVNQIDANTATQKLRALVATTPLPIKRREVMQFM